MAKTFNQLTEKERRSAYVRGMIFMGLAWVVLLSAFFFLPEHFVAGTNPVIRFVVGGALIAAVAAWQGHRIVVGKVPQLRAVEALGTIVPFFLVVFAMVYLASSTTNPHSFNEPLNHVRALYFTVTVFSTVGFGDITPTTDSMRMIVAAQMLLDLILIGSVVRILFSRAKQALAGPNGSTGSVVDDLVS